ncbi:MAG: hypothetical protein Q7T26_05705 [Dehalococcoidia bacterium]|nr:hypothetical protein [Dehalococcoidia bacterium]
MAVRDLLPRLDGALSADLRPLVHAARDAAAAENVRLYVVGGAVRDLLLGRPLVDVDIVVEGDAASLARRVAQQTGGRVEAHDRFGTAKVMHNGPVGTGHGQSLDLATARTEKYVRPGALPTVQPGTLAQDLARRDFTINAIALGLTPPNEGVLLDPFAGQKDMAAGLVRVLHDKSFVDDATRIFRSVRYEQRLGFRMEPQTEALARRDIAYLDAISGDRVRNELDLLLREDAPERGLARLAEIGALERVGLPWHDAPWLSRKFAQARRAAPPGALLPEIYLGLLMYTLSPEEASAALRRLNFPRATDQALRDVGPLKATLADLTRPDLQASAVVHMLERFQPAALQTCAFACDNKAARERLRRYLAELRYVKSALDGHDLARLGVKQGPRMGQMLKALRDARLDGEVRSREDEEARVRRWLTQPASEE